MVGPYRKKLRPRPEYARPRSQFFPIRNSQPVNNIYIIYKYYLVSKILVMFGYISRKTSNPFEIDKNLEEIGNISLMCVVGMNTN